MRAADLDEMLSKPKSKKKIVSIPEDLLRDLTKIARKTGVSVNKLLVAGGRMVVASEKGKK